MAKRKSNLARPPATKLPAAAVTDLSAPRPDVSLADIESVDGVGLVGLETVLYARCQATVKDINQLQAQLQQLNAQREQLVGVLNRASGKLEEGRTILLDAVRSRAQT